MIKIKWSKRETFHFTLKKKFNFTLPPVDCVRSILFSNVISNQSVNTIRCMQFFTSQSLSVGMMYSFNDVKLRETDYTLGVCVSILYANMNVTEVHHGEWRNLLQRNREFANDKSRETIKLWMHLSNSLSR